MIIPFDKMSLLKNLRSFGSVKIYEFEAERTWKLKMSIVPVVTLGAINKNVHKHNY